MQQGTGFYKFIPMRRTSCLPTGCFSSTHCISLSPLSHCVLCDVRRFLGPRALYADVNTYIREQFRRQIKICRIIVAILISEVSLRYPSNPVFRHIYTFVFNDTIDTKK